MHITIPDPQSEARPPSTDPQQGTPGIGPLPSHRCGAIDRPALGPGAGPHTASARCRHCGHFLRWLSTRSPAERQARRQQARLLAMAQRPPSQPQLLYLQALEDDGPVPGSMLEAAERLDALVREEVRA
jgi:hypothetical protein